MIKNGWTEELDRLKEALERTKQDLALANDTLKRYEQRFDDFAAFINILCDMLKSRIAEHQFGDRK